MKDRQLLVKLSELYHTSILDDYKFFCVTELTFPKYPLIHPLPQLFFPNTLPYIHKETTILDYHLTRIKYYENLIDKMKIHGWSAHDTLHFYFNYYMRTHDFNVTLMKMDKKFSKLGTFENGMIYAVTLHRYENFIHNSYNNINKFKQKLNDK